MSVNRKRALVLLNTSAGGGKTGTKTLFIAQKLAEAGYEPVIYPIIPGTPLVSEELLSEYEGDADLVICSGGDGTLNHVIQSIVPMENPPHLAYLPSGSTNDFAKGLGIPADIGRAMNTALNGNDFRYDVGRINDRYFNYVAAFGAFSAVSYATDQKLKNVLGYAAYIVSAVADMYQSLNYNCHMKIEINGQVTEGNYIFGAVSNSPSMGGFDMPKREVIKLNDGKMELFLIRTPDNPQDLYGILNALTRGDLNHSHITFQEIEEVTFHSDEETAWSLDGEYGGVYETANVRVLKQAVAIRSKKANHPVPRKDNS